MEFMDLNKPVLRISIVFLPSCITLHPIHQVEKLATFLDTVRLHSVYLSFHRNNNFGYSFWFFLVECFTYIDWLKKWWKVQQKFSLDWINVTEKWFTVSNAESRSFTKAPATCSMWNNRSATSFLWSGGVILHRASVSAVWKSWSVINTFRFLKFSVSDIVPKCNTAHNEIRNHHHSPECEQPAWPC